MWDYMNYSHIKNLIVKILENRLMNIYIKLISLLLILAFYVPMFGQTYNSPYSRFGLGDFTNPNYVFGRSMGNNSTAYADLTTMNPVNPASYSWLNLASFNVAFNAEFSRIKDDLISENRWSGNLDYMGIAFPLRNYKNEILDPSKKKYKLGMAFFAKPFSTINYDVTTRETIAGTEDEVDRRFFGTGGTYNIGWGNSIKFGNFSAGLNLGYLFGKINNNQDISLVTNIGSINDEIRFNYSVSGFTYDAGFLYKLVLNKEELKTAKSVGEKYLLFGLRGHAGSRFSTSGETSLYGVGQGILTLDSIKVSQLSGMGKIPAVLGLGVNYFKGRKFNVGFDFEYSPYASFENTIRPEQEFRNVMKIGVGGKYKLDDRGFGTFLERTAYGFGVYYNQDPRIIVNQNVDNYGITLGMAMPFFYQQNFSEVNVSLDLGRRGTGTIISENFIQLGIGMNFNDDSWFIQRKYN